MPRDAQLDALAEAILQHHMQQLNQPAPVAPTPPGFQGLGPIQAAAAAINPQFAPLLIQNAQAPAQARYQQQQQAFEAAMAGKQQALAGGTQLLGMQSREDIAGMRAEQQASQNDISNRLKEMGLGIREQGIQSREEIARLAREAKGTTEPSWQIAYDKENRAFQVNPKTGETRPLKLPSGQQLEKPATAAEFTAQKQLGALDMASDDINELEHFLDIANGQKKPTPEEQALGYGQHSDLARTFQAGAQAIPGVATVAGYLDPMARSHENLRAKITLELNPIVTSQNRLLQAEIQQFNKYLSNYGENPATYKSMLANARASIKRMRDIVASQIGEQPAVSSAAPSGQFSGKSMSRQKFDSLKSSEQKRWTDGGGTVQ